MRRVQVVQMSFEKYSLWGRKCVENGVPGVTSNFKQVFQ